MIMVDDYMLHSPFTGAGDIYKAPVSPVDVATSPVLPSPSSSRCRYPYSLLPS
jgi:hypothetical protein